jgi:hypothetical protein
VRRSHLLASLSSQKKKKNTVPSATPPVAEATEAAKADPDDGSALTGEFTVSVCVGMVFVGRDAHTPSVQTIARDARSLFFTLFFPSKTHTHTQWRIPDFAAADGEVKRFSDQFTVGTYPW